LHPVLWPPKILTVMARWLISGIGFLLLIGLVVLWGDYINRPRVVHEPREAFEKPIEKAITQPAARSIKASAAPSPAAPSPPAAPPAVSAQAAEPPLSMPPTGSGPIEALERAYRKGSTDSSTRETERAIRSVLTADIIPSDYLRSVTCHKTVCKIGVFWSKQQPLAYMALIMKVGTQQAGIIAFTSASAPGPDGKSALDVYVVRAGFTLDDVR
jgi:hypothetical protein